MFYYFRLEDQVPENHLLRLIDKHISFEFGRPQLKDRYRERGRPSIARELGLRILLIGYLYGIASERKLVEEMRTSWCGDGSPGGVRPGDPAALNVLQEPTRTVSGVEAVRAVVSRSCDSVRRWDWYRASICRWMAAS